MVRPSIDTAQAVDARRNPGYVSPGQAQRRPPLLTGQIAEGLGVSADTVRRHWPHWQRAQGFPSPLPLPTNSPRAILRWDADAFDAWRSQRGAARGEDIDTTDWAAVARARGLALDRGQNPDA